MAVSNRICPQCDAPLAPNEIFCSNCGTQYTEPTSVEPVPLPLQSSLRSPRRPNVALLIGISLLVFLLIGSGVFFFVRMKSNTTSNTLPTSSNGTTSNQRALFSDNFVNNSKAWDTGSGAGFSSIINGHGMELSEANHKILYEPIPGDGSVTANYSDFSATTTFTITKADQNDSVGFYMRGDDNLSQGYFVDIFGDNTYDIVKVFPDAQQDTFLISPTSSSAINPVGQQNKLTVLMKGSKIVVLINDKVVNSISDNTYTEGQLALFVENGKSSDGVKAIFSSVTVYPAPAQLSG